MTAYRWLIPALWLLLLGFWLIAALGAKHGTRPYGWRRAALVRLVIVAVILVALRFPAVRHAFRSARAYVNGDPRLGLLGVALCVLGVGVAIWARIVLGTNWGMPMSRKDAPELITTGPYAFVRHPIYTGFLLVLLGTAIAVSPIWFALFIPVVAYFIYSAGREERFMAEQFPDQYPAYKKRTKMLLPFIL